MLLTKEVNIAIGGKGRKYWEDKGYYFPLRKDKWGKINSKRGTCITIKVEDLPKKSPTMVLRKCDVCGKIEEVRWYAYRDVCRKCTNAKGLNRKYDLDIVRKIFKDNDCELLSDVYVNSNVSMLYKCSCEKISKISLSNLLLGQRCKQCGIKRSALSRTNLNIKDEDRNRRILGYSIFINSVKKRDKYICVKCGCVGKKNDGIMNCHHIESWLNNEDLRLDINNGITLCNKCHNNFHHIFGIKNNNRNQFNEFMRG